MIDVIFSFDIEDYVNKTGVEGISRAINLLNKHGVIGCFNVVARFAMALEHWERQDVIQALKDHQISTHSFDHSYHPTICEYTDIDDYYTALDIFLKKEDKALNILKAIFDKDYIYSACAPGISTSYVAYYGYRKLGVPAYLGGFATDVNRLRPVHFCNVLSVCCGWNLERNLFNMDKEQIKKALYEITDKKELFIFGHHPAMAYLSEFYDELNYMGENTHPDNWKESKCRSQAEIEKFYENFDYLLSLIKADPNFHLTTYKDLAQKHSDGVRTITKNTIPYLREQLNDCFFPVTMPDSYCISDIIYACRDLLKGKDEHICSDVYGFLHTPYAIDKPMILTKEEVIEGADQIKDTFLPENIVVGDKEIGPADWLRAAMDVICGEDVVKVQPNVWQIDLDEFPKMKNCSYKGWVHYKDFPDNFLSDRLRLQSWTIRFDRGTPRKIFD